MNPIGLGLEQSAHRQGYILPVADSRAIRGIEAVRGLARKNQCAVKRRVLSVGEIPTRQLSFQPVAIGTVVEVTKRLKLPV